MPEEIKKSGDLKLKYHIILFKLKGHETWRKTDEKSFEDVKREAEVIEHKVIEIDRLTGKVTTLKKPKTDA